MTTRRLGDVARVVRSKNAGPFEVTLDVIFPDAATYERVKASGTLTRETVARLYGLPPADVHELVFFDPALAVKATIARKVAQGSVGETDTYAAQQHAPLLGLEIDWDGRATATTDYAALFNPGFRLEAARAALVVVDMQHASASREHGLGRLLAGRGQAALGAYRFDRIERVVVPTIRRLLAFFRARGLRVLHLMVGAGLADYSDLPRHMRGMAEAVGNRAGRPEHEILPALAPAPGEAVLRKTTMSAFHSSGIERLLRSWRVDQLVLAGVSTNSCVEGTARDAADLGYQVVLVEDGCGAASQALHDAACQNFARLLGRVAPADTVLAELAEPPAR